MPESSSVVAMPRRRQRRPTTDALGLFALLCALIAPSVLATSAVAVPTEESAPPDRLVLDHGHVDLFSVEVQEGDPVLLLREDVTGNHVPRQPADVELHVKEEASVEFPAHDGIPEPLQGQTGYYLPVTQDPNLLWPGWDSQSLSSSDYEAPVNVHVSAVDGPGEVYLWASGSFGGVESVLDGDGYRLPGTITQEFLGHVHANWAFTQPGEYRFTVSAEVRSRASGEVVSTREVEYYFTVGEVDRAPETVTVSKPEASYASGAEVVLTAEQSPEVSGAAWSWESAAPGGKFVVVDGQNSAEYRGSADIDGEQVRAVVTVGKTRIVSDPVAIVVEEAAPPEAGAPACFDTRFAGHKPGESPGHLDAFFLYHEDDQFHLAMQEDITAKDVTRAPEDVEFHVPSKSLKIFNFHVTVPPGLRGKSAYFLPSSTTEPGIISPGWASEAARGHGYDRANIEVLKVDGPGDVYVWNVNAFDNTAKSYFKSGTFRLPETVSGLMFHSHVKWAFTEPGVYYFDVRARVENGETGAQAGTEARRYLFTVGENLPEGYRDCQHTELPAYPPYPEELIDEARGDLTLGSHQVRAGDQVTVTVPALAGRDAAAFLYSDPVALTDNWVSTDKSGAIAVTVPKSVEPGKHRLAVIDESNRLVGWSEMTVLPADKPAPEPAELHQSGSDSEPAGPGAGRPSDDTSTEPNNSAGSGTARSETAAAAPSGAPSKSAAPICYDRSTMGGATNSGATPASMTSESPQPTKSADYVMEGHFDLGPVLEGGNLALQVKDDRTSPPTLRDPSSLVFVLDDAHARRKASTVPSDLSFIAPAGRDIWMIQQIQEPGVPWLGLNTQHESIANGPGADGAAITLDSVDGPGDLAIFQSGNFGQAVGERMMDTVGGPTSYVIAPNTHQHANWVFTEPGAYAVTFTVTVGGDSVTDTLQFSVGQKDPSASAEVVGAKLSEAATGVTASGEPCALPQTGTQMDVRGIGIVSVLFAALGAIMLGVRRLHGAR